jgi:hypothetical protein
VRLPWDRPGIDMVVVTGLLAAIGPVTRFAGPDKLVGYLGLNPSVHQSGEGRPRHGRITKQGRTHARTMLVEAAWQAVRGLGPLRAFYQRVARRRGNHIAAVAVARKLAVSGAEGGRTMRRRSARSREQPGSACRPAFSGASQQRSAPKRAFQLTGDWQRSRISGGSRVIWGMSDCTASAQ